MAHSSINLRLVEKSRDEICGTCRFWTTEALGTRVDNDYHDDDEGQCRRYPPKLSDSFVYISANDRARDEDYDLDWNTAMEELQSTSPWYWPMTCCIEWCGEHQKDPTISIDPNYPDSSEDEQSS